MRCLDAAVAVLVLLTPDSAHAASIAMTYEQTLDRAAHVAPDLVAARAAEAVTGTESAIAGLLPNPSVSAGTSSQTAKLSVGVSVPLLVLGQRGAAIEAGKSELAVTRVETELAATDVRALAAHAFVALWHAQSNAAERDRAEALSRRLEEAVSGRVDLGAAPDMDGLRARAEHLRASAEAQQATLLVAAAGSDLSRWLDLAEGDVVMPRGDPTVPAALPPLTDLRSRLDESPPLRRERAAARAADARADHERALVRPSLVVDAAIDAWDPTLCTGAPCSNPPVNYRGGVTVDLPILNQRGPYIDRELAMAAAARSREGAERARLIAGLTSGYRTFEAWTASARALGDGVVPAADAAAVATEESYALGRATLVALLDAERARIDARLALLDARTQQADAWIEVEHVLGTR